MSSAKNLNSLTLRSDLGRKGEELAAAYLDQQGFQIVAANFTVPVVRNRNDAVSMSKSVSYLRMAVSVLWSKKQPRIVLRHRGECRLVQAAKVLALRVLSPNVWTRSGAIPFRRRQHCATSR